MANIRVTCPACKSELEIDSQFEGQEVECGGCLEVFVARRSAGSADPGTSAGVGPVGSSRGGRSRSSDRPGPKKRRRDDRDRRDDGYDDEDYAPPPPRPSGGGNSLAVAALVLGVLSIFVVILTIPLACVCCCGGVLPLPLTIPLSLAATITGAIAVRNPEGRPMSITGLVLGCLSLGFVLLQLAFNFVPFMVPPPPQAPPGVKGVR